jgi:hypothetical protein
MRTKRQILKDYLTLLNVEKKLGYTEEEIENKLSDSQEMKIVNKMLLDELYTTTTIEKQEVSSDRAWFIWCKIIIHSDFKTGYEVWNNFIRLQFDLVENNRMVCYMAARGHGKTFFLSMYILFKMFLIPYFDVGYCSNIPKQRRRFLKLIESMADTNEMLMDKKDRHGVAVKEVAWGTEEMEYNHGLLEGTTVGTTPRGGHYNLAIGDDPLRDDKKYTYEFYVNYFQGVYKQTTLRKKGRYIIVGTPMDPEDLFHTLMNDNLDKNNRPIGRIVMSKTSSAGFFTAIYPAILDEEKKLVLVPEFFTFDELMREKTRIGEIRFNRELLCKCTTYKNSLVGNALFRSCCDETMTLLQRGEEGKKYIIVVDSATSDAPTADYCAMSVWEEGRDKLILRNLVHEKGFPITDPSGGQDDQPHKLLQLSRALPKSTIVIERNNAGIALIQAAQALGMEIVEHVTHVSSTMREGKAEDIVNYIEHGLKAGVITFPSNSEDNYTIDALEKVKAEHLNFGVKRSKSGEKYEALAGHDDIFTTCVIAFKYRGDGGENTPGAILLSGGGQF